MTPSEAGQMTGRESTINIATDFSEFPAGRYKDQGPASGEEFRERILKVVLQSSDYVHVVLDGAKGYGSSFLEEAFGGLIRKKYFTLNDLKKRLSIEAKDAAYQHYIKAIWEYIQEAVPES
jgi:hypothetical protein